MTMRKEFEARMCQSPRYNAAVFEQNADGTYVLDVLEAAFNGYVLGLMQAVPQGWQAVPKRLTQDMADAAKCTDGRLSVWKYADVYTAMLANAPKPTL